jgi:hypothetical protein
MPPLASVVSSAIPIALALLILLAAARQPVLFVTACSVALWAAIGAFVFSFVR